MYNILGELPGFARVQFLLSLNEILKSTHIVVF